MASNTDQITASQGYPRIVYVHVNHEGRAYRITIHPDLIDRPATMYRQIHRMRKDGTVGAKLDGLRDTATMIWAAYKDTLLSEGEA